MEIKEFIEKFAENFEDVTVEDFAPETNFKEIDEWSSFLALSVMAMIGDEYDVTISAQEMRDAQTVQDLYNVVSSQL
jgi:acyl carrier protein